MLESGKRWNEEQGKHVVAAWRRSGLKMSAYAREIGIGVERLIYWRDRVEKKPTVSLVPVRVRSSASCQVRVGEVEVVDANAVDPRWVAALLREMERER